MMVRYLAAFALSVMPLSALWAGPADPLDSPACKAARAELDAALAQASPGVTGPRLARAREDAAAACLGRSAGRAHRSGAPEPAQRVPPVAIAPAPRPPAPPALADPPPAVAVPRPIVITTCDPAGCWDSEGRRLDTLGPLLMGPRGPCTVQGGLASCP